MWLERMQRDLIRGINPSLSAFDVSSVFIIIGQVCYQTRLMVQDQRIVCIMFEKVSLWDGEGWSDAQQMSNNKLVAQS